MRFELGQDGNRRRRFAPLQERSMAALSR